MSETRLAVGSVTVQRAGGTATITVDRQEKRNALSREVLDAVSIGLVETAADETIKVLIVTGAGRDNFTSGGDLVALAALRTEAEAEAMARHARGVLDQIRTFPVPVVAAVNGDALGGGAELALACDHRVVDRHARMGFVQGRQAVSTAWGGGVDLLRTVGPGQGLRLLCTTEMVDHEHGLRIGLYDRVVAPGEALDEAVADFVAPLLRQSVAVLRTFKALTSAARMGSDRSVLEQLELERFRSNWVHPDHWAALDGFLGRDRRTSEREPS
ncbi:enoyl-CoA hydratase/isomerase family protein [soil metagenome]